MNERIRRLRDHIQELNDAGVRRTTFYELAAASLRETVGEPTPLRRARAFARLLDNVVQAVLPHELLAGSIAGMWPLAEGLPDYTERRREATEVIEKYRDAKRRGLHDERRIKVRRWALMARDHYDANVEYGDLQELIGEMKEEFADADDLSGMEIARELEWHFDFDYGEHIRWLEELPWIAANHLDLNYERLVRRGLGDIRQEILERGNSADEPREQVFYEASGIAVDAAIRFIERYADTLLREAEQGSAGDGRAEELREMAGVCRKVATGQPETFREALQLLWLVHVAANVGGGSALSFARFDQYMWPFYERDRAAGTLTREQAKTLLSCMWLKVNEPHMRTVQSICLAGMTPEGECGANELSELCLEVCRELGQPYPNVAVRVGDRTPEWLYERVVETMKVGIGHPMLLNDGTWIPNLLRRGYSESDARNYYNMGCVEIMAQGVLPNWTGAGGLELPGMLELVFRNGEENLAGQQGVPTGTLESFETFEQFLDAYLTQVRHAVSLSRDQAREQHRRWQQYCDPFASAFIGDCLERGRDVFRGGSRYGPVRAVSAYGLATATDSLAAVRKFVFDEGRITLQHLWEALEADYEGYEELRVMLERQTPHYGNDIAEVDELARRILGVFADAVHDLNDGSLPGAFGTSVFSYTSHVSRGETVAAMPDGRKAREPISDTIAPTQGKDVRGPTCMLNSVAGLDPSDITAASALNVKFTAGVLRGETGSEALKSLLKVYMEAGGPQIQVNVVDQDILRDAQKHPERHGDLVVRVAGFCEYFTSLDRELQDEIISRTAHDT
ncbi:MAG: pyruvate formate lyase family protein [Candidatus Brocadiaceae bacterium]